MSIFPATHSRAVRFVLLLVALTALVSLLYAAQYYVGGPLRLKVTSEIHDLALSPDGSLLAAAANDGTVRLWEVPRQVNAANRAGWFMYKLSGHEGPVVSVTFDSTGTTLYSTSQDGTVLAWDVATKQVQTVLEAPEKERLVNASLSGDDLTLASLAQNGTVHVWGLPARGASLGEGAVGQLLQSIQLSRRSDSAVALSSDGAWVAAANGTSIQIWDARTGESLQRLESGQNEQGEQTGHKGPVTALAFSPDRQMVASGSTDKRILFWDLASGEVSWVGEGHFAAITDLVFAQDGQAVLSGSADNKARLWRLPGGKSTGGFVGHLSAVNAVTFGPQPNIVLTGGEDGTVRMWDVPTTSEIHIEWVEKGLLPLWGKLFSAWMLTSGLVGVVAFWGLWNLKRWSYLLVLAVFIVGPVVVLGLPLFEAISYPFPMATRLGLTWPLLGLALWYAVLVSALVREPVAAPFQAPSHLPLAEQLMITLRTRQLRMALYISAVWVLLLVALYSVLRRFDLDLAFMSNFLPFIMGGASLTIMVSAASIALAVILALFGALGRLSNNAIANGISGFYISVIRGTPLLVQIYIWYLGLPRLDIILSAVPAGILALGVNYGAYMTETFRAGIQAVSKGQHEAAQALGMTRAQTLRRIVLPQAFRIVIPPIGNDFIAMMKDSSLVMVMAVWELTFRASKIGRQYFRSMETFIIAAAFYWVLTMIFQFLQGKLEAYMARGERR